LALHKHEMVKPIWHMPKLKCSVQLHDLVGMLKNSVKLSTKVGISTIYCGCVARRAYAF
jgi:hypothetical protein